MLSRFRLISLVVVLTPLLILLGLQYRWLVMLEVNQTVAITSQIDHYLEEMIAEVEHRYRLEADRAAESARPVLSGSTSSIAPARFEVARLLFVVDLTSDNSEILFFDAETGQPSAAALPSTRTAIEAATAPWRLLRERGGPVAASEPVVDARDPSERLLFHSITDDSGQLLGLAGLVLDEQTFLQDIVPRVAHDTKPSYCPLGPNALAVRGPRQEVLYPTADKRPFKQALVASRFSGPFADYHVGFLDEAVTPKRWARTAFLVNVSMAAALALSVLLGVFILVRSMYHEMELVRMKTEFLANVSHQLKTPISSIRAFGELLGAYGATSGETAHRGAADPDPARVRRYGARIERESRRLGDLVDRVLGFASLEAGARVWTFSRLDVVALLREELTLLEPDSRERVNLSGLPELSAHVDEAALRQALRNLIDNALRYSPPNTPVEIDIRLIGEDYEIRIQDRGPGIATRHQKLIFERFHRLEETAHDVPGTGLGLSIGAEIARAHGGAIAVFSREGAGSKFVWKCPVSGPPMTSRDSFARTFEDTGSGPTGKPLAEANSL